VSTLLAIPPDSVQPDLRRDLRSCRGFRPRLYALLCSHRPSKVSSIDWSPSAPGLDGGRSPVWCAVLALGTFGLMADLPGGSAPAVFAAPR